MIAQLSYGQQPAPHQNGRLIRLHSIYSRSPDLETFLNQFLRHLVTDLGCRFGVVVLWDRSRPETGARIQALDVRDEVIGELTSSLNTIGGKAGGGPDLNSIVRFCDSLKAIFSCRTGADPRSDGEHRLLFLPVLRFDAVDAVVLLGVSQNQGLNDEYCDLIKALVLEMHRLADRLQFSEWSRSKGYNLRPIGSSNSLRDVERLAVRFAASKCPVLITGEPGTGKELIAHSIHFHSPRRNKPFVIVNCGAFTSDSLLASEMFGHVKGAFTDARTDRKGQFELADGGTLFLDEVACMSPAMQIALLRALRYGEIQKVGDGSTSRRIDVRIVAACNEDLTSRVKGGSFREDMYSRLSVAHLTVPPLRERPEDISLLADYFLTKISQESNGPLKTLTAPALSQLLSWSWPDNIAGLENALRYAYLVSGDDIQTSDLPGNVGQSTAKPVQVLQKGRSAVTQTTKPLARAISEFECSYIAQALKEHAGNISATARALGISRQGLQKKISRYKQADGTGE